MSTIGDGTSRRVSGAQFLDDVLGNFGPEIAFSLDVLNIRIPVRQAARERNIGR